MKKLELTESSKVIGGGDCDRIGARLIKLYEKGRDISRNAERYVRLGCAE